MNIVDPQFTSATPPVNDDELKKAIPQSEAPTGISATVSEISAPNPIPVVESAPTPIVTEAPVAEPITVMPETPEVPSAVVPSVAPMSEAPAIEHSPINPVIEQQPVAVVPEVQLPPIAPEIASVDPIGAISETPSNAPAPVVPIVDSNQVASDDVVQQEDVDAATPESDLDKKYVNAVDDVIDAYEEKPFEEEEKAEDLQIGYQKERFGRELKKSED